MLLIHLQFFLQRGVKVSREIHCKIDNQILLTSSLLAGDNTIAKFLLILAGDNTITIFLGSAKSQV